MDAEHRRWTRVTKLLGMATLLWVISTALPPVAHAVNTCNGQFNIDYVAGPSFVLPGDTLRVQLTLGTGSITGGSTLTVNRLRFDLDCNSPGNTLPCTDEGAIVEYEGDGTITTTCAGTAWASGHPLGTAPNEVVLTPTPAVAIAANTPNFCNVEFDIKVLTQSVDSTPTLIEEIAGYSAGSGDGMCNNGLSSSSSQTGSIPLCPVCNDNEECTSDACNQNNGQCVFTNLPDSTQCTDNDTTDCITAGCNGLGTCDQAHINVPDSTPCPDTDTIACPQACNGSSAGTCAGCNGLGTCDQTHIVCTTTTTTTTTSTTTTTAPISCGNSVVDPGEQCDPPGPNSAQCPSSSPVGAFLTCQANCTCCIPQPEVCGNTTDDDCDGMIDCADPDCSNLPPCIRRDPSRIRFNVRPIGLDQFTSHGKVGAPQSIDIAHQEVGFVLSNARGVIYQGVLPAGELKSGHNPRYFRYKDKGARLGQGLHDGIYSSKIQVGFRGTISYHVKSYANLSAATEPYMAIHFYVGTGADRHAWGTAGNWRRTRRGWVAGKAQLVGF